MLFIPEAVQKGLEDLANQVKTGNKAEIARGMLELWPEWPDSWVLIGLESKEAEAIAAYWKALELGPCAAEFYFSLSNALLQRDQVDVLGKRLRHLGLWKIALMENVPSGLVEMFKPDLGDRAAEPEAYEMLARSEDLDLKPSIDPPDVADRLRPYRLLNDVQRDAPDDVPEETLRKIMEHASECAPLFRSAIRQWAREEEVLDFRSLCLLIAISGEIGGPELADDLIDLADSSDKVLFLHVHWAIRRLGKRHPDAVLERFQAVAPGASVSVRCAIADQLVSLDGVRDEEAQITLLVSLLDGVERFVETENVEYLLATVAFGLRNRERWELEKSLVKRYQKVLTEHGRDVVRESRKNGSRFAPVLMEKGIDELSLEDVCLDRLLMKDEEDEEDFLDDNEDAASKPPDSDAPVPPARGESLYSQLMKRVLDVALDWLRGKELERARNLYFGTAPTIQATQDEINRFFSWMLHDYRDSASSRTPIEYYLQAQAKKLTPHERKVLESLRDARYGLFEVERLERGAGIQVRDLGSGEQLFIHDVSSSNTLARWDALLARIQSYESHWLFAGDGLIVPRELLEPLLQTIRTGSARSRKSAAEFIRNNSYGWIRS